MKTQVALAALLLAGVVQLAVAAPLPDDTAVWSEWKAQHNKQYETPAEESHRLAVFLDNKKLVDEHNAKFNKGEVSYSMGLNAFSDLTSEEFAQRYTGLRTKDDLALRQQWSEWKAQHNKQYETAAEEARRYAVFQSNKKLVDEHNAKFNKGEVSYSMGLNAFSGLTSEELIQRHTGLRTKEDLALRQDWSEWKAQHNKQYETAAEEARRYAVFQSNKKLVDEHNAKFNKGEVSFSMGLNAFSDLTSAELKARFGHGVLPRKN